VGNLIYTAGHLPQPAAGGLITGKVGTDLTTEQGYDAARAVALNLLATIKGAYEGRRGAGCRTAAVSAAAVPTPSLPLPARHLPLAATAHCRLYSRAAVPTPSLPPPRHFPPHPAEIGDLDKVKRIVKLTAFVNCVDGSTVQPKVANGASELLGEIFGEKGKHARSAVGVNALPLNVPVEIEAIVEVE